MSTMKITSPIAPPSSWVTALALLLGLTQPACHAPVGSSAIAADAQAQADAQVQERDQPASAYAEMPAMATSGDGVFAVTGGDPAHHRLRFVDGQVSRNDSCMIRLGNRLNRRVPPMYVNGEPVGFC